jgi:carbon starvation protein
MLALWYHFAIMFEAVFLLATLDAGTRVGRFMLQDLLGHAWAPLGRTSWYPSVIFASIAMVSAWGYFLYVGVIDPNGGVNILWPLFGISNQMLAAIALSIATGIIIKSGKARYALVTLVPLAWLAIVTTTAALQKITSPDVRIGLLAAANDLAVKLAAGTLPAAKAAVAPQLIFNQRLDAVLTLLFTAILWLIILDMARICVRRLRGLPVPVSSEAPYRARGELQAAGATP